MSESEGSGAGQREVAYRIFAAEFEAADYDYSESDEERAPNYVITPTGARANRLFIVGVLTEIEQVSEDVLRARVVDPTGAFVLYAGQYQPDEQAFLEQIQPPTFVAVTGKARTFQPDDSDQVFTSVRPESISEVDDETRDRWTVQTAEQTIDRIRWMTTALATESEDVRADLRRRGADGGLAHGVELALDHYGTTPTYLDALRDLSLDAARVVAGEADEVEEFGTAPDAAGDVTVADLAASFTLPEADEQPETTASADDEQPETTTSTDDEQPTAETDESATATASVDDGETTSSEEVSTESDASPSGDGTDAEPATESAESTTASAEEPATEEPTESDTAEPATEMTEEPPASEDSAAEPEADSSAAESDELGDFEPEEFELEEETREEIEEEYGTEFQSGTEVDEPGSADIDTPDPADVDGPEDEPADAEPVEDAPDERPVGDESEPIEESADAEPEPDEPEPVDDEPEEPGEVESPVDEADEEETGGGDTETVDDPQQAVVDLMGELDDGDGAAREELVAEMGERYGLDSETVEDAIQSALMEGQCYEPDDEHLKPI
ncbi:hypothetical protein [Halovenus sp. HT40]|uniref:hypothetical protein n=1 Tax=Halovenus sp. HT40 TaxID=3126691 RepID=UPI00300F59E7